MEIIITPITDKGKIAIKSVAHQKDKHIAIKEGKLVITIPRTLSPFIRVIQSKTGIAPQYAEFIKLHMKSHGATEKDYTYEVK